MSIPFVLPRFDEKNLEIIIRALRNIATGRSLATGTVTLTPSATTTVVSSPWVSSMDFIALTATTANAKTAIVAGYFITAADRSFTITHASNAAIDQTCRWHSAGG